MNEAENRSTEVKNGVGARIVSVRKFTATLNTGDSRGIFPHSIMYGVILVFVRYERFGESCTEIACL